MSLRISAFFFLFIVLSCSSTKNANTSATPQINTNKEFADAAAQYKVMMKNVSGDRFPRSYDPRTAKFVTSGSDWWCSGFYPGTLLYLYEQTKDKALYDEAMRIMTFLEKEKNNTSTHDLGFMMFCSFGNANRIHPKSEYNEILLTSAKSLSTRFNPKVGCIKSWNAKPSDFIVIIDNMMNLELLFWATAYSGDSSFYKIAVTHANTSMKNHFRPDYSSYHVLNYDPETGAEAALRRMQIWSNTASFHTFTATVNAADPSTLKLPSLSADGGSSIWTI